MPKPMPLPVSLTDCLLLNQMGYEVRYSNGKPVKVFKKRSIKNLICKVDNILRSLRWDVLVTRYKMYLILKKAINILSSRKEAMEIKHE